MTKKHLFILLLFAGLLFAGCNNNDDIYAPEPADRTIRTLKVTASIPIDDEIGTRVTASQKEGSKDIELRWKEGDKIQLYFKQGETITEGEEVEVQAISSDGKRAEFNVSVPAGITGTFDLYGVHGVQSVIADNTILLDALPSIFLDPIEEISVPIYFKAEGLTNVERINVAFRHYGALQVLTFKNDSFTRIDEILMVAAPTSYTSGGSGEFGYYFRDFGESKSLVYDVISGETSLRQIDFGDRLLETITIPASTSIKIAQWVVPNGNIPDELTLGMMMTDTPSTILSKNTKPKRTGPLQPGHAYHLYAVWDGTDLSFTNEAATVSHSITFTTTKNINEKVKLNITPKVVPSGIWIDLNNNGNKDEGEDVDVWHGEQEYTIGAQTITLYGNMTYFSCANNINATFKNNITSFIYINSTLLESLVCYGNQITTLDFGNNTAIRNINCVSNLLSALDVTKFTALETLRCDDNRLTSLDVSNNTALTLLECYSNKIKTLDVSNNTALTSLRCQDNLLETLVVTSNTELKELWCEGNKIKVNMALLINSLPDRNGEGIEAGEFRVKLSWDASDNVCTKAQVAIAKSKNWNVKRRGGSEFLGDD